MRKPPLSRRLLFPAAAALAVVACTPTVDDGPAPTLTTLKPDLVCDQQLSTPVVITGTNFTPVPIRTLGGTDGGDQPQSLQLPKVQLTESQALSGSAMSGMAISIPDSPDDQKNSDLKWESETEMTMTVVPALKLTAGVYDVTVTNPDGKAVTAAHTLAAVDPPSVTVVNPNAICDAQSNVTVTVTGTNFLTYMGTQPTVTITPAAGGTSKMYPTMTSMCTAVATSVATGIQECTQLTFVVMQNDLPPGDYTLTVTNPAPANCVSSEKVTIHVNPPPKVTDVNPKTICQGGGTLDVTGMDFQMGATVSLGTTNAQSTTFVTSMELQATFGGGNTMFTPGMKYDVTVTNPDGCKDTLPQAVLAVPGPVLFFVDPPVVYNGITTQVTMFSTSITPPLMSVTMTLSGGGGQPITLTTAKIDPLHPKRILADIPSGTPAGTYDITVTDGSGCPATLPMGLKVVDQTTVTVTSITPGFGDQNASTAVTITGDMFESTPRVYLNPHTATANSVATALSSVAFFSAQKLTAIVPKGLDPASNPYDLIVVNPDGTVGILANAYNSEATAPPVITGITPQSLEVPAGGSVTIFGKNFPAQANLSVVFTCGLTTTTDITMTVSAASATSITVANNAMIDALTSPNLCTIKVTDTSDMAFATFEALAISGSSGNLSTSTMGTALPDARRATVSLAGSATAASPFLYVIGGDKGDPTSATNTVFFIDTNTKGTGASWFTNRYTLNANRTLATGAQLGRYLYVAGGNDGTGPVKTAERAMILDPEQAPVISDIDIVPGMGTGLGGGIWYYRVAALMDPNDNDNPGGETLPSDVMTLQLPDLTGKLQVTLTWTSVQGAVGYRIYRSPTANGDINALEHLADVTGNATITYVDMGGATTSADPKALNLGSTGKWKQLPDMMVARESAGVAIGQDPSTAGAYYVYATFGRGGSGALSDYEFLPFTVDASTGQQTISATAWTQKTTTETARYQHEIYSVTNANASNVPVGTNYIYVGGGTNNGTSVVQALDAALVTAGGTLGAFTATGKTIKRFGAGYAAAANFLYAFSGDGLSPSFDAAAISTTPPAVSTVNNNGSGLLEAHYLPGSAISGALIYLVGGSQTGMNMASTHIEWLVY